MDLNLTASNYTLEWSKDTSEESVVEGLHSNPPEILFIGRVGDVTVFTMLAEQGASATRWTKLADACSLSSAAGKDWGPCNGETYINVVNDVVEFTIAKHGDGCGGSSSTFISARCCVGAFREAASLTEAWLVNQ